MKRILPVMLLLILPLSFLFAAEPIDLSSNGTRSFNVVVNKSGTNQIYFSNPDNLDEVWMNAQRFPILSSTPNTLTLRLGVVWSLFPELENGEDSATLTLKLEASSSEDSKGTPGNAYMMANTSSSSSAPQGLNYKIDVEVKNGGLGTPEGIDPGENITEMMSQEERTATIFSGDVYGGGTSGNAVLKMTLSPARKTNEDGTVGEYYMEGYYRGYLILRVEVDS